MQKFNSVVSKIKAKQVMLLLSIIVVLSLAMIILACLSFRKDAAVINAKKADKKFLTTGSSHINPQEVWVHQFSSEATLTRKRLDALEGTLEKLLKLSTHQPPLNPQGCSPSFAAIEDLKQTIAKDKETDAISTAPTGSKPTTTLLPLAPSSQNSEPHSGKFKSKALQKVTLNLNRGRGNKPLKTTDNTIPAGAFAKVVLLGGVDASTSIQASSDPRPILLRLTNPGTLPRRFKSDLEGCHVLAASYGDLSSERVFMRLEKLTCIERKTGEVLEMNVQGYVAGEDGRAGLRGKLVDRAGESMRNAMVGGFFSSIGNFLGQSHTPAVFSPHTGLSQSNPLSTSDILKQSTANGVSGALDKYADFYIKRAEQMQPVIQVAAGRKADIVFTEGTEFTDSSLRQMVSKINDQKRYQQVQSLEETKPLGDWLSQPEGGK